MYWDGASRLQELPLEEIADQASAESLAELGKIQAGHVPPR